MVDGILLGSHTMCASSAAKIRQLNGAHLFPLEKLKNQQLNAGTCNLMKGFLPYSSKSPRMVKIVGKASLEYSYKHLVELPKVYDPHPHQPQMSKKSPL